MKRWASPKRNFQLVPSVFLVLSVFLGGTLLSSGVSAHELKTLYNFCEGCKNGAFPVGLTIDGGGDLYGVTEEGGKNHEQGWGSIYELKRGSQYKLLYVFCQNGDCSDGTKPSAPLIIDMAGNLYGTALDGGAHGSGVVFELSHDGTYHHLYDFCAQTNCADGAEPPGGLTYVGAASGLPYDGVSPLYGLAGTSSGGVAYQLTPAGQSNWTYSIIYSFCSQGGSQCTDGAVPVGNLLADASGNLFGAAASGGANHPESYGAGGGVVFELSPNSGTWTESVLYNFCAQNHCSDGAAPGGSLVQDASGAIFGTTLEGGGRCTVDGNLQTCGTLFRLSSDGAEWQESVLHTFCKRSDCPDGAGPNGGLVMDVAGDIFGTTIFGGGNDSGVTPEGGGVVYELSGLSYKVLHHFCALADCADGRYPRAGVIFDTKNNIDGTTSYGGTRGAGTVFKLKP